MVQMLKEDYGAECKVILSSYRMRYRILTNRLQICTRPFTIFRWKGDRAARQKRSIICLTCARLKNCCQCCMLDLSFGLPITIRDAALKMIAPGPNSSINREYYAQEHEKEIEDGRGAIEAYEKTDEKAMELLKRLAKSEPYAKRRRMEDDESGERSFKALPAPESSSGGNMIAHVSRNAALGGRGGSGGRGGRGGARGGRVFPSTAQLAPTANDWLPPRDPNIKSLFIVGVEDDLAEFKIRNFFADFGALRSVVCSHRSHCAYINYMKRSDAEKAAESCHGKAVIAGCPLRVTWGRPKQLDTLDREERMSNARQGRNVATLPQNTPMAAIENGEGASADAVSRDDFDSLGALAQPPGEDEVNYASLAGN